MLTPFPDSTGGPEDDGAAVSASVSALTSASRAATINWSSLRADPCTAAMRAGSWTGCPSPSQISAAT